MAVEMWEQPISRDFTIEANSASIEQNWFIRGTGDEVTVEALLKTRTPRIFRRLIRNRIKTNRVGPSEWFATIEYGTLTPGTAEPPDSKGFESQRLTNSFTWDTTGATAHINQSLKTISKTTKRETTLGTEANKYTLDNQRAIGISKEGVAGCDKYLPQFQWTYEQRLLFCTGGYMVTVAGLVGTINSTKFFGFGPGEVLYLGANGRYTVDDGWTVTHKFLSLPTRKNIQIAEGIIVEEKRGHDYLWVGYVPQLVGQALLHLPESAYVEQIYLDGHFWLLGIGGVTKKDALRAMQAGIPNGDGKGKGPRKPRRPIIGKQAGPAPFDPDAIPGILVVPQADSQTIFQ